jgi:hypothetical protein
VVEESVPWGTVNNVRVRMPGGNDIWLADSVLETMQAEGGDLPRRMSDASPSHIAHGDVERMFDEMGQRGELDPEVADHLKRRLILGTDRAGAPPKAMRAENLSGERPKYSPGTAANRSGQPPSEAREIEKQREAADMRPEAPFSSPGRSARDMGKVETPPTPAVAADAHMSPSGHPVTDPRTEGGEESATESRATTEGAGNADQRVAAQADGDAKPTNDKQPKNRK